MCRTYWILLPLATMLAMLTLSEAAQHPKFANTSGETEKGDVENPALSVSSPDHKCCGVDEVLLLEASTPGRRRWRCGKDGEAFPPPLVATGSRTTLHCSGGTAPKLLLDDLPEFLIDSSDDGGRRMLYHVEGAAIVDDFCLDKVLTGGKGFLQGAVICQREECPEGRPCVRRCCPREEMVFDGSKCRHPHPPPGAGEEMSPFPWPEDSTMLNGFPPGCVGAAEGSVQLREFPTTSSSPAEVMQIDVSSGDLTLMAGDGRENASLSSDLYCLGRGDGGGLLAYFCRLDGMKKKLQTSEILDWAILALSALCVPFLISTLFVIRSRRSGSGAGDNTFGILTVCMICSLLPFYSLLVALVTAHPVRLSGLCLAGGLALQFCYLSAVAWLNCMCFAVWSSLRSVTITPKFLPTFGQRRFFCGVPPSVLLYSAWGLGYPLVGVAITVASQFATSPDSDYHPGIGRHHCFLSHEGHASFLYLHLVAGPLLLANLLFYVDTTRNLCCGLWRPRRAAAAGTGDTLNHSRGGGHGQRSMVAFRMFFAMGVPWAGEVASWALRELLGETPWTVLVSGVCNVINASQGILIFLVIFFDLKTMEKVRERLAGVFACSLQDKSASGRRLSNEESADNYANNSAATQQTKTPQRKSKSSLSPTTIFNNSDSYDMSPRLDEANTSRSQCSIALKSSRNLAEHD